MERPHFRVPTIFLNLFRDEKTSSLLSQLQGKPPNSRSLSRFFKSRQWYVTACLSFVYLSKFYVYVSLHVRASGSFAWY